MKRDIIIMILAQKFVHIFQMFMKLHTFIIKYLRVIIKCKTKIPGFKRWVRYYMFIFQYLLNIICVAFQHYIQTRIFVITKAIFEKKYVKFQH